MVLCEVDFMAEKQSFSATISIFRPTIFQDFDVAEYYVGNMSLIM
jgi:hypothetical protein